MTAAASDLAINVERVSKTYRGRVHALRDAAMRVHRGEVFGLLGPNGAGKSTLVKILMTIVRPSKCRGQLLGEPIGRKSALTRVGYLPEHLRFPDYLTGEQSLHYFAALAKVPRDDRRKRAAELLDLVGLEPWGRTKITGYSKGMRQRLGIAQSMMNDPDLVLLDEPTDGVDPVGRRDIRNLTVEMKNRGKAVLINSHMLSELEMVCDRVSILVKGRVRAEGRLEDLTGPSRRYEIEVDAEKARDLPTLLTGATAELRLLPATERDKLTIAPSAPPAAAPTVWRGSLPTGEAVEIERNMVRIGTTDADAVQPAIDALRRLGLTIRSVRPVRATLEDLFMQAIGDDQSPGADRGPREKAPPQEGGA